MLRGYLDNLQAGDSDTLDTTELLLRRILVYLGDESEAVRRSTVVLLKDKLQTSFQLQRRIKESVLPRLQTAAKRESVATLKLEMESLATKLESKAPQRKP